MAHSYSYSGRYPPGSPYVQNGSQHRQEPSSSYNVNGDGPVNGYPVRSLMDCGRGVMNVEVHMATGIIGDYFFGLRNSSPYVIMKYGHNKKTLRSHIHRGSGSEPRWNETFSYNNMNPSSPENTPFLHFEIWNHHHFSPNNMLGRVSISNIQQYVASRPRQRTQHLWLPIFHVSSRRQPAEVQGKLLVRFYFESKDEAFFGDGLYREDHTYRHGQKNFDDITATCIEPHFRVLEEIPVDNIAGTVIQLDLPPKSQ